MLAWSSIVEIVNLGVRFGVPFPIVEETVRFAQSLLCYHEIFHTPLCRSVLFCVPHGHTVLLCSSFLLLESFLSFHRNLRCCLQNHVLYHRPSRCVCHHTRLNFRENTACSSPNGCVSWTGLRSWMVSILCGTTMLWRARCHACGGTSGAIWRRSVLQITSAR